MSNSVLLQLHGAIEATLTKHLFSHGQNVNTTTAISAATTNTTTTTSSQTRKNDHQDPSSPFVPVICNRVGWWTHRAMTDAAAIETESNQITALVRHLVANHHSSVQRHQPVVSVLCGADQLASQIRVKIQAEAALAATMPGSSGRLAQLLDLSTSTSLIKIVTMEDANAQLQRAPSASSPPPPPPLCSIFAFGSFPAALKSRRLEPSHGTISSHFRSGSEYSFVVGHYLWPDSDGPLKVALNRSRGKLLEVNLTVATSSNSSSSGGGGTSGKTTSPPPPDSSPSSVTTVSTTRVPDTALFSPCLALRCARHPEQVSLLASSMSLPEMKAAVRCNRLCRLPLRCGNQQHLCTERCHGMPEHFATPCPFPCGGKVPGCEHPCRMLCGEVCDCLKRTKRDRECSHVTLKGHTVHHRFEGSCTQSHSYPCQVSVPVRCAHCYGIGHVPCSEVQETLRQQRQDGAQQQQQEQPPAASAAAADVDIPTMPTETFKCHECRDVEFRVRSQVKLELQNEAEAEKQENRRDAERHRQEQEKAARRGIFQIGQQAVISNVSALLDPDLAAALFGDSAAGLSWVRTTETGGGDIQPSELLNVVGAVVARQSDPTDPTVILYILSLPTFGGHVAVADTGLALVRGVFKADAEHNQPLLLIENKKAPAAGQDQQEQQQQQQIKTLDKGTRVVVLRGSIASKDLPEHLVDVFYDQQQQQQQHDENHLGGFPDIFDESGEEDIIELGTDETTTTVTAATEAAATAEKNMEDDDDADAAAAKKKRAALPEFVSINNVVGSVYKYVETPMGEQPLDQPSKRAIVWVDIVAHFNKVAAHHADPQQHQSGSAGDAGSRRSRESEQQQQMSQCCVDSEELLLEVMADPQSLVPLFPTGSVVRVREPARHVLDPAERERFHVKPRDTSSSAAGGGKKLTFIPHQLPREARCTVQGFVNAPKVSHAAAQQDALLRTASRRGPCYLVSLVTRSSSGAAATASAGQEEEGVNTSQRVAVVPVFFVDLDTDEIADQAVAKRIREELDLRCAERVEAVVEERYLSNREADEKRLKAVAELHRREQQARRKQQQQQQQQQVASGNNNTDVTAAPPPPPAPTLFVTSRILLTDAAEKEATQRFLAAKRYSLGSHGAMLQRDATGSAESLSVQQLKQFFVRERGLDDQTRTALLKRVQ